MEETHANTNERIYEYIEKENANERGREDIKEGVILSKNILCRRTSVPGRRKPKSTTYNTAKVRKPTAMVTATMLRGDPYI